MMEYTDNSTIMHSETVISAELEDNVVLMNMDTGDYYDIDPVGSAIWAKIEQPKKISILCEELIKEFDVDAAQCRSDVMEFIDEMTKLGAIEAG